MNNFFYKNETIESTVEYIKKITLDIQVLIKELSLITIKDNEKLNSSLENIKSSMNIIDNKMQRIISIVEIEASKQKD